MTFFHASRPRKLIPLFLCLSLLTGWITSCNGGTPSLLPSFSPADTQTFPPTNSPTLAATQTPYVITATAANSTPVSASQGIFFLAIGSSGYTHIYAYSPETLALTRLTTGNWDDTSPVLSPDQTHLAFASNRNGYWNLYTLELATGSTVQLTDSPEYKGNPSWSSDGAWITYDTYFKDNLEIHVRSVTDPTQVFHVTEDPALDAQPAWLPVPPGRQIAFVSNRGGEPDIWIANLDVAGNYTDVSLTPQAIESHPAWSPDGTRLAWAATDAVTGLSGIYVWDTRTASVPAQWVGSGSLPIWRDADHLIAGVDSPNQSYLTAYNLAGALDLPPVLLPGPLEGLTYGVVASPLPGPFQDIAQQPPATLVDPETSPQTGGIGGRAALVEIDGLQAPYSKFHSAAAGPFQALRDQVARSAGWDALASLENAYIPLTTALDPGLGDDWLYTGRAFTLKPVLTEAGWMAIVREDFGQQTYWRIYLKTTAQDGSQGAPLQQVPWDFAARTGSSSAYEAGGELMDPVPPGYWLDLTSLAVQFGWQRLPALTNWRTYYGGARYNELAYTQGLDWRTAMLQLYPADVLVTPTVVIPPTRTPTRTPMWWQAPTYTRTPTFRPTNTP